MSKGPLWPGRSRVPLVEACGPAAEGRHIRPSVVLGRPTSPASTWTFPVSCDNEHSAITLRLSGSHRTLGL